MQRIVKESAAVAAITCVVVFVALLVAQGRIGSKALLNLPMASAVFFDSCYAVSLPGVMVAVAIWGYNSERTPLSDAFVVAVNTILYSLLLVLLMEVLRFCRRAMAYH